MKKKGFFGLTKSKPAPKSGQKKTKKKPAVKTAQKSVTKKKPSAAKKPATASKKPPASKKPATTSKKPAVSKKPATASKKPPAGRKPAAGRGTAAATRVSPKSVGKYISSWDYSRLSHNQKLELAIKRMSSLPASIRPKNSNNKPGGLVEFAKDDKREFIIVGDIHANHKNLRAIFRDSGNLRKIEANKAVIVFLGDIVHDERTGHLMEMESSISILDVIIHAICKFPHNIIYLLGNHDTFDPQLSKSNILQGELYREVVVEHRGESYAKLLEKFFGLLPVMVKHPYFLAMHAGPVRGGVTRSEVINIDAYPESKHQLSWNRINETRSTPSRKEYANDDLEELRKALKCPANIPVFVGHNPMWKWGGNDAIWINPLQAHDHVIVYSGAEHTCPYISVDSSSQFTVYHADLRIKKKRFVLD